MYVYLFIYLYVQATPISDIFPYKIQNSIRNKHQQINGLVKIVVKPNFRMIEIKNNMLEGKRKLLYECT